jgi:hypothetical protein
VAIPQFEIEFDKSGRLYDKRQLDAALVQVPNATDAIVIAHGWNNDKADATELYDRFFKSVDDVLTRGFVPEVSARKLIAIRILWPSKRFTDEELIPGGGAASLGGPADSASVVAALERLKADEERLGTPVDNPLRTAAVTDAQALVPRLESDPAARREFVLLLRSILNPGSAETDDGSMEFFAKDPQQLFADLQEPVAAAAAAGVGGGATAVASPAGGAAGLRDFFGGVGAAARRLVNFTTYYEMKDRAGLVGRTGVAQTLRELRRVKPDLRLHLVGHSFGGRLVAATAHELDPNTTSVSVSLLQAAFSHNGLAQKFDSKNDGHFRRLVSEKRASGPIIITHTKNDRAVGVAYPLASRIAFQKAAALGDENDVYGGMGRNGAQHTPEATKGELVGVSKPYTFAPGTIHNLKADAFIKDHSDIAGHEVAYAVLKAAAAVK